MTLTARWIDSSLFDTEEVVSVFADLSLWSAPFGLALLDTIRMRGVTDVLDVGCGAGFPLIELADRFGPRCRVAGVDPWRTAVLRAQAKARTRGLANVEIVLGKAEALPFPDGSFDLVVSNNGLNNVADMRRALGECARTSREGAQLVITANLPGSMRELYDVYEAVLRDRGRDDLLPALAAHIDDKRKPISTIVRWIEEAGFSGVTVHEHVFRMRFADGTALFRHWFMRLGFIEPWASVVPHEEAAPVLDAIEERLNARASEEGEVSLTVPFACIEATRFSASGRSGTTSG
jgi:arsenite methyltransferase